MGSPSRPDSPWPHTGAVLAGGASRRMGRPKHELTLPDGRTMLDAVIDALDALCREVVVVGEAETSRKQVHDLRPGQGPLAAVEALLASGNDHEYLVCPCDLPLITPALLKRLTVTTKARATVFRVEGEPDFWPMPARLSADALPQVQQHLDEQRRALHDLVRALGPEVVPVTGEESRLLANVNTPADYSRLTADSRSRAGFSER